MSGRARASGGTPPEAQPVRRRVQPYPWRDWFGVVARNVTQRPTSHHRGSIPTVERESTVDVSVAPAVRVAFLGDLMPIGHRRFVVGSELGALLRRADHLVANFEGVLWSGPGRPPKVFAAQRHTDLTVLDALADVVPRERIVASVANNHAADFGWTQHRRTCDAIVDAGFGLIGSLTSPGIRIHDDVHVAAATQWTNQAHDYLPFVGRGGDPSATGLIDPEAACNVLVPHWGIEHELYPRPATVDLAHRLLDHWDLLVGHHPHVPCPVSTVDHDGRPRLVAWSLGQASSDLRWPIYRRGIALVASLGPRPDGRWSVGSLSWQFVSVSFPDDDTVLVDVDATNPWFPELEPVVGDRPVSGT